MTSVLTRDPVAYRRKRRERAILKAAQITQCYVEYAKEKFPGPPQITQARPMLTCMNRASVSPKFVGRGVTCLTIYEPIGA